MKGINEYRCTHQIAWLNCCHMITAMLYLSYDNEERSTHDGRRASSTAQKARMEPLCTYPLRKEIPLCSEVANATGLYWASFKIRPDNRRAGARKTSQGKIKATHRWHWKTKNLVASGHLALAWKTSTKAPKYSLPYLLVYTDCCPMTRPVIGKSWVCERKKVYP